jgi:hypothetical protein
MRLFSAIFVNLSLSSIRAKNHRESARSLFHFALFFAPKPIQYPRGSPPFLAPCEHFFGVLPRAVIAIRFASRTARSPSPTMHAAAT